MKKLIPSMLALLTILGACSSRELDNCSPENTFGNWGVMKDSKIFGNCGDKFYVINPVAMINDSLYYNADYTDSYFVADSTRIVLQYMPGDSIKFYLGRLYAVQVNPNRLIAFAKVANDTAKINSCSLNLNRIGATDRYYGTREDTTFINLLKLGKPIEMYITNAGNGSESEGSQNYHYNLYPRGFSDALARCNSLNFPEVKTDTVKDSAKTPATDKPSDIRDNRSHGHSTKHHQGH